MVVRPQLIHGHIPADMHIAQECCAGILSNLGELVDDILQAGRQSQRANMWVWTSPQLMVGQGVAGAGGRRSVLALLPPQSII